MARVQFRYGLSVEINGVPRNFYSAEVIELNYSLIEMLLSTFPKCLYFDRDSDRIKFYALYPELRP
jgi:hypothetical protein